MRKLLIGLGVGLAVGVPLGWFLRPSPGVPAPVPPRETTARSSGAPSASAPVPSGTAEPTSPAAPGPASAPAARPDPLAETSAKLLALAKRPAGEITKEERARIGSYAGRVEYMTAPWTGRHVEPDLVRALLASEVREARWYGARLAGRADPPKVDEIADLLKPGNELRVPALAGLDVGAAHSERLRALLAAAIADPVPGVRLAALRTAAALETLDDGLRRAVLEATRDPDAKARHAAILLLPKAGAAALPRALEMAGDPDLVDRDELDAVAAVLVAAGRVRGVLSGDVSPEMVSAIVHRLESPLREDLTGLFETVLPRFRPRERMDANHFFSLAAESGDARFVRKVALDRDRHAELRLGALTAELIRPPTAETGLRDAGDILRSRAEDATFRKQVVEVLADTREQPKTLGPGRDALLEEVARTDPDRWVREAAARALRR